MVETVYKFSGKGSARVAWVGGSDIAALTVCIVDVNTTHWAQPQRPPTNAPHTLTGDFRLHAQFPSRVLDNCRDVLVYLPPGYTDDAARDYPVLYMQDGQNLFDGATSFIAGQEWRVDETAQWLIESEQIAPLIIVGINNTGEARADEYTPTHDGRHHVGGKADLYGRFLIEELKPFVDANYRTRPQRAQTALGGSSLGGLVSMYLGLTRPDVFGRLAVMSPSVWWGGGAILREVDALWTKPATRVWLDTGTAEGGRTVENARRLRDALVKRGWELDGDLCYHEAAGAQHNEAAWAARVEPMLRFLFPPD